MIKQRKQRILWWLSVVFCFPAGMAAAQFNIGIDGGLNIANASHSYYASSSRRPGFVSGIFVERYDPSSYISYQAEIHFIQKGATLTLDSVRSWWTKEKWHFNYIEVPLLIRTTARALGVKPFLFFGPKIGVLISSGVRRIGPLHPDAISDPTDETAAIDLAVDMGGGVEYAFTDLWEVFLSYRFSLGLQDIDRSYGVWRSRDHQWLMGVKYALNP